MSFFKRNWLYLIPVGIAVYILGLFIYGSIFNQIHGKEQIRVEGELLEVIRLAGDSKKKKVLVLRVDGKQIKYSSILTQEEYQNLKFYKGKIILNYIESPFGSVFIKKIETDKSTLIRKESTKSTGHPKV